MMSDQFHSCPHIVITGASSGIGAALAKHYYQEGYAITLVARSLGKMQELTQDWDQKRSHIVRADLSQEDLDLSWVDQAIQTLGPIDVLVNNAGMQYVEPLENVEPKRIQLLMNLNLTNPMKLMHAVLKDMLKRKRGSVINVASVAGLTPTVSMCHYNGAKAGLAAFSESSRVELKGSGVHIMTVYPGPIYSPMEAASRKKLDDSWSARCAPTGQPHDLAQIIYKSMKRKKKRVIYPRIYMTSKYLPNFSQWISNLLAPGFRD